MANKNEQSTSVASKSLPLAERDTLQAIEPPDAQSTEPAVDPQLPRRGPEPNAGAGVLREALATGLAPTPHGVEDQPIEASVKEHGVWGTTSSAVGRFGESYDEQVAHGAEADLPAPNPEEIRLEHEVRKTLARAHVDAADLRVAVRGDHVTLYGSVREALEKTQIEARARGVPGVVSLTSHLNVLDASAPGGP